MAEWDIYVPDLPGFGRAPPSGDRSIASYAELLGELITKVSGDSPVALAAHSVGGAVATLLADNRPAALVNVEGNLIAANTTVAKAVTEAGDFDASFEQFADNIYPEILQGSGHFPMLDAYDGFYQRLDDWLRTGAEALNRKKKGAHRCASRLSRPVRDRQPSARQCSTATLPTRTEAPMT